MAEGRWGWGAANTKIPSFFLREKSFDLLVVQAVIKSSARRAESFGALFVCLCAALCTCVGGKKGIQQGKCLQESASVTSTKKL